MSDIDFELANFENQLPSDISDSDAFSELLRFSHARIAEVTKQRDELGDALQRFVNRLQYSSVYMDGKMTCARVNRNPIKEWDEDCIFAFEVLEKLKGGER